MSIEQALVFIDAGYLSKISKYFGNGKHIKLDLVQFSFQFARKQNLSCEHIFYYTVLHFKATHQLSRK